MSAVVEEAVAVLLLLVVNGVFAMSEMAVVTARTLRLEQRAEEGDAGARAALELARAPAPFLSTVQVGITLVGVLAGAFGGATLSAHLAAALRRVTAVPAIARWADALALAAVVGAITYGSLILGELVPKRIALAAPERVAALVARPMRALSRVVAPVVAVLTGSTNLVLRLLGVRAHSEPGVTEAEIRAMVEQGAESGVVAPAEHEILERTFRLGDRTVAALMTPRPDVEWLDLGDPPEALRDALAGARRSPLLVCRGELDDVVGFVRAEVLLARAVRGEAVDGPALQALADPPLYVPEGAPAFRLTEELRARRAHAAVVVDEYGGVAGLVTRGDLLEALVGEIPDAADAADAGAPIVAHAEGRWVVDGDTPIVDVEAALDADLVGASHGPPVGYHTLGGFVMARLGRVPRPGDRFDAAGLAFEVAAMDGRRVGKVGIARPGAPDPT